MLFKNIHVILGRVVLAGKAGVPLPGRQHQYTWSLCLPAICLFSFASRVWLRTLVLKGTAAKPSINCNAESPGLAWRLLHESTSGGDPTMQQSVGSCAGGTHKELSKADPYSDDLVSRGFILSLKKKKFRLGCGKNSPQEFPHCLSLAPGTVQEQSSYCLWNHIVFVWGRSHARSIHHLLLPGVNTFLRIKQLLCCCYCACCISLLFTSSKLSSQPINSALLSLP